METKTKTFNGSPCYRCNGTLRYFTSRGCVSCSKNKSNNARTLKWQKDNPERYKANQRKYRCKLYGITPDDYERMLREQDNVCAICKQPCERGDLCIDHNHNTKAVRGLLCRRCNQILGLFKDDPKLLAENLDVLHQCIDYLDLAASRALR